MTTDERYVMSPIGHVRGGRTEPVDDDWGGLETAIELVPTLGDEALAGLETFSHVEVLYVFHAVSPAAVTSGARHPRGNAAWPRVGIFAQRAKNRPNRIGASIVRIVRVEPRRLVVAELDAIDGTPVLDLKPVMRAFLPGEAVTEPAWATELMRDYFRRREADGTP